MTSKEKIGDIHALIDEMYSDKKPLNENQKASRDIFFKYCNDIKRDLERLECIENVLDNIANRLKLEVKNIFTLETEIFNRLEILEQLKEILSMNYLVRVYGYEMAKRLQTYLKSNDAVKRWLDGKD